LKAELLRGSAQTKEDKTIQITFDKVLAGDSINWVEMQYASYYMQKLVSKFPPSPPSNRTATLR